MMIKHKKKPPGFSARQRQLIKKLGETGGNLSEAGRRCDPPYESRQSAWQAWNRIRTNHPEIAQQMEEHDQLNRKALLDDLAELIKSTRPIGYLNHYIQMEEGGLVKVSPGQAVSNDFLHWPDWSSRARGLQLAFKLRQEMADRIKVEEESSEEEVIIKISAILKGRGKTWPQVCKHLVEMGAEIPAGTPSWWDKL